ncbi:MAG: helicase-associated domain-containing protein [Kibdelosporangium sp.]
MPDHNLAQYLRGLSQLELAEVLRRRPETALRPVPSDALQLAQRLLRRGSVENASADLNHDCVIVAQAIDVLAGRASRDAVIELLNADPGLVDAALRQLLGLGLVWPAGEVFELAPILAEKWRSPLGLGKSVHSLLDERHVDRCREAATALGIPLGKSTKAELVQKITDVLGDPAEVKSRLAKLSPAARELVWRLCTESPRVQFDPMSKSVVTELLVRGLLIQIDYLVAELPAEVGMAVNPPGERYELTGPPSPHVIPIDPEALSSASAGAAHEALAMVTLLLDNAELTPIAVVRSGGIGTREQKRLAKSLRCNESDVVLWLDTVFAAKLLDFDGQAYVPTDRFDSWRDQDSGARWLTLARAWYGMDHAPTGRLAPGQKQVYPPMDPHSYIGPVRRGLLKLLWSVNGSAEYEDVVGWFCPMVGLGLDEIAAQARFSAAEATRLGVVAHGALAPLGQAMLADDVELARRSLPEVKQSVNLQSDLTAVVAGEPTREVLSVLRGLAAPETARTWRFTPDTVRHAFDSGMTAAAILDSLASIATHGVPQPLEYLVNDIARRHGQIRAVDAACCVVAEESQAAEILATRSLRKLGLRQIASTVLVSAKSVSDTLGALRAAGFAPVGEAKNGAVLVERTATHRVFHEDVRPVPVDVDQLAARILAAPIAETRDSRLVSALRQAGPMLTTSELTILGDAIETGGPVRIQYQSASGGVTSRVIREAGFDGVLVTAWCMLRDDERVFSVNRILAVDPA